MVGLVLVSHSEQLAAGLRDLVVTLAPGEVAVEAAGGTDDGRFGTSYQRIEAAIAKADRGDGVVVLADMGSAVLTVRTVLDDRPRADVLLIDAPLVEGAVAAAVLAATGAGLDDVSAAAAEAREVPKF
ncbi:dihydroxyacetone kinase phosphoryl donor subunit DhaM [Virgisporangium aurantiacum]|uniref:phosphoenolpyruvate--glycerone phosphotransferase n=1 Tax=Virgisporangium aurantiacum TaxID=175570 RepID=A0A8J4E3V7_9ACTN|nr:dihydroxyacetone kinase phosphoryl donor subunit DhaM [Virgisporangium aurantiacum]GIJ60521.1 PTS fructose transporter subunit IIA [Virgisporangium aurantiacum]